MRLSRFKVSYLFVYALGLVSVRAFADDLATVVKDTPECRGLRDSLKIESASDYQQRRDPEFYNSIAEKLAHELNGVLTQTPSNLRDRLAASNAKLLTSDQVASLETDFLNKFGDLKNRWDTYFFCPAGTKSKVIDGEQSDSDDPQSVRPTSGECLDSNGNDSGVGLFVSIAGYTRPWKLQIYIGDTKFKDAQAAVQEAVFNWDTSYQSELERKLRARMITISVWPGPASYDEIAKQLRAMAGSFKGYGWVRKQLAKKNCLATGQDLSSKTFMGKRKATPPIQTNSQSGETPTTHSGSGD